MGVRIVATRGTGDAPNSIVVSGGNLVTVFGDAFQVRNGVTNITLSNGATMIGNSALLRVLDPPSATVVNLSASHASLIGDIFADPASQTTVHLTNSSVLTGWEITVSGPGWLAGVTGDIGSHGVTSHVDIGPRQILLKSNVLTAVAAEIRKGQFGLLGGFLYINAQDGAPAKGLVSKVDLWPSTIHQPIGSQLATHRGSPWLVGSFGWIQVFLCG